MTLRISSVKKFVTLSIRQIFQFASLIGYSISGSSRQWRASIVNDMTHVAAFGKLLISYKSTSARTYILVRNGYSPHRVDRVLDFFCSRPSWDPLNRRRVCASPWLRGGHTRLRERGWVGSMNEGTLKTPTPKCRLYWSLLLGVVKQFCRF
jgi:hypothetical protein